MFGDHMASMNQQLVAAGMSQQQANIIADTLGQCMARLQHRGAVEFNGPAKFTGQVRGAGSRVMLFDGSTGDGYFTVNNMTGTLSESVIANSMSRIFSIYTLAADLNADASVVAGGKTYVNSFCRDTYKLVSGTTVAAINGGNDSYYIIAWDACEVVQ